MKTKAATKSKKPQVKVSDLKPGKDVKGGIIIINSKNDVKGRELLASTYGRS